MEYTEQEMQFVDFMLSATELVEPGHRSKMPEYVDWLKNDFLRPKELVVRNGYGFYAGFSPDAGEYAYHNLEWKSSDILLSTYAKTGTTWVNSILQHIICRNDPEMLKKHQSISQFFTYLTLGPVSKYEVVENLPIERRLFATHLPPDFVNLAKLKERGTKVIYVIRNPKDQPVSWYNFAMSLPFSKCEHFKHLVPKDENKFYEICIAGKQRFGMRDGVGYLEMVREWYEHKNDENFLFLMFEKIKKDPRGEIRKLAKFIGESPTEEELDWIVEKTTFSSMKKGADSGLDKSGIMKLFRKGQIGDWKNHLTVAQSELIDQKVQEVLGDTESSSYTSEDLNCCMKCVTL